MDRISLQKKISTRSEMMRGEIEPASSFTATALNVSGVMSASVSEDYQIGSIARRPVLSPTELKSLEVIKPSRSAENTRPSEPFEQLVCPNTLRLERKDGGTTVVPAHNYYLNSGGQPRPYIRRLVQEALTRDPQAQAEMNERLREAYARYEMSFRVKNHETGAYDKIFKVPVNGFIAPIKQAQYDTLINSSKPVMRAFRSLLQKIYSAQTLDAKSLGLTDMPEDEQEQVIAAIRDSIYFEPSLVGPEMKDYPFLAVGGFDAAVGNLETMDPVFFEVNLGTPSGMSNNAQLLQLISEVDPKLFNKIRHNLPEDNTFALLRHAIESNAKSWTRRDDGISVVVSPGVYNGAHPDVASICMFTGMPLVRPKDLYQDEDGWIRLNTGEDGDNPVVTGIYGRAEESFFLQNHDDKIYMKTPAFADPSELEEKLGVTLQPGVLYDFKYGSDGEIIGVKKDGFGNPVPQSTFDRIGSDPIRPDSGAGSFLRAIKGRKLYYSALGGRTVDDKRIFQSLAEYLAPSYRRESDRPVSKQAIAHPPRTLKLDEYGTFYNDKDLHNYVVKEPDRSGGDGVYLLVNLTQEEREDVVRQVKANPSHFIVQQFAEFALMMTPEETADGEGLAYGSQANDWRLFIVIDGDGNVDAGPNSLLLRTAQSGSASTNTSQGGGYGIGVVLSDFPRIRTMDAKPIVPMVPTPYIGVERKAAVLAFIDEFNELTLKSSPDSGVRLPRNGNLSYLAHQVRKIMDILGREMAGLMSLLRDYDDGEISQAELYHSLLVYRATLYDHESRPVTGLDTEIESRLASLELVDHRFEKKIPTDSSLMKATREKLIDKVALENGPEVVRETHHGDRHSVISEIARYTKSSDPALQEMIEEAQRCGAEIRYFTSNAANDEAVNSSFVNPYFRISDNGKPIIGIDLTQDYSLPALAHEMEHLKFWLELKDKIGKKNPRLSDLEICTKATRATLESEARVAGERRSVEAEMRVEDKVDSPYNTGDIRRAAKVTDEGYVARVAYPEIEGIRDVLHRHRWGEEELNSELLAKFMNDALDVALATRSKNLVIYEQALAKLSQRTTGLKGAQADRLLYKAKRCAEQDLFAEIFRYDLNRFIADETARTLFKHFKLAFERNSIVAQSPRLACDFAFNQQLQEQE